MSNYIKGNFEISIIALLKYIVSKWILILTVACFCGLICAGYRYITFDPVVPTEDQIGSSSDISMLDRYNIGQENIDRQISELYDKAAEMEEYTSNSIYYNLNPTSFAISTATFELVPLNVERNEINALYYAYLYEIIYGDYLSDLSESTSIPKEYLIELISVISSPMNSNVMTNDAVQTCPLVIAVYGESIEQTDTILDCIINEIPNINSKISHAISHDCIFISRAHTVKREDAMRANHASIEQYVTDLYGKINNLSNCQKNIPEPSVETSSFDSTSLSAKSIIKYAFVGLLLGLFLVTGIFVLIYILDDKVSDIARFQNRYNVRNLGNSNSMIIANIMNYKKSDNKILITGMATSDKAMKRINELKKMVDGICVIDALDILNDSESRSKLLQCDDVILVEEKAKSKYSDIDEELCVLSSLDKNVIGVVLV